MFDFLIPLLVSNPVLFISVGVASFVAPAIVRGFGWADTRIGRVILILGNDVGGALAKRPAPASDPVKP